MKYGCIGEKLGHSFSKDIHEQLAHYEYELREIAPDELESFIKGRGFAGINVTIPYKEKVIPFLDNVDPAAAEIGAVNTVVNRDGVLYGYNTDYYGLRGLLMKNGFAPAGRKTLICGTGATSRTARAAVRSLGGENIIMTSRTEKPGCVTYEKAYEQHTDADYIINTTPCGTWPDIYSSAVDISHFLKLKGVFDVVYNPIRSLLVSSALEKGVTAEGGLYMLVAQAVEASAVFKSAPYAEGTTDRVFEKILKAKENIVLTGMPGAGKTTVGRALAAATGRKFLDTDELIAEKYGATPAQMINTRGEKFFREKEKEIISDIARENTAVIATGGGAVLDGANMSRLRMNGRIVYLKRGLESLAATSDRPLSSDREKLARVFAERKELYETRCDVCAESAGTPEETAKKLKEMLEI